MATEIPTIHLNGTSSDSLLEGLSTARSKLRDAIHALANAAPNKRDFYVQNDGDANFAFARERHYDRQKRLTEMIGELEQIEEGILTQVEERQARRKLWTQTRT